MMYVARDMERTQIYLSDGQTRELDRRARQRGTTRSALIREALEQYLRPTQDPVEFKAALRAFSGIWADRDDLDELYAGLRHRGQERLDRLRARAALGDDRARPDR